MRKEDLEGRRGRRDPNNRLSKVCQAKSEHKREEKNNCNNKPQRLTDAVECLEIVLIYFLSYYFRKYIFLIPKAL